MTAPLRAVSPDDEPVVMTLGEYARQLDAAAPVADRAVLLGLARAWGGLLQTLVHEGGVDVDRAVKVLLDLAAEHSHPAAREWVVLAMPLLVDAVDRRERLHTGRLHPRDVVDGVVWTRSRMEQAAEQLDREIEDALAPLLSGLPAGAR